MGKRYKLGVIGAGFMAQSIVKGVLSSNSVKNCEIIVSDISVDALNSLGKLGVSTTTNNDDVFHNAEYVLLAVKPQTFATFNISNINVKKIISIMAGINKAKIKEKFPSSKVVRCMPNTPVSVGFGAVGIDCGDFDLIEDKEFVKNLFSSVAKVVFVEEDKLLAVTGVSGSAPAYFYLFAKSLIDAGVNNGLTKEQAETLVVATMKGSAEMINGRGGKSLDDLISAVCSKGGTTIEAMKKFEENNLLDIVNQSVEACVARAKELENI